MAGKKQIYVWDDVLADYSDGCIVVVARSLAEAKEIGSRALSSWDKALHDNPKVLDVKIGMVHWQHGGA